MNSKSEYVKKPVSESHSTTKRFAFTLAEGGHSPLLYGQPQATLVCETKWHKVLHAS